MSAASPEDITQLADPNNLPSAAPFIEPQALQEEPPTRLGLPLKVVIASSLVLRVGGALTASLLGSYLKQVMDAGPDLIGILSALFYVTELVLAPFFGALSDLRGRRPLLILGPLLGVIALPIYPISALAGIGALSIAILAMARLIEGISTAAKVPSALGYLADATTGEGQKWAERRGRVMGFYEISFLVGFASGYGLGGFLWERMHEVGFYFVSLVYLIATLMLFFLVPESLPASVREQNIRRQQAISGTGNPVVAIVVSRIKSYGVLLKEPALRSFVPAWLAINAIVGLLGNLVQPLLTKPRDGTVSHFPNQLLDGKFEPSQVSLSIGAFGLTFMVGIYVWSLTYGRIRKTTTMLIAVAGIFPICLALYGINDQVLPQPWGPWALTPVLLIGVLLVSGFTPVALAYLAEISAARVEHRGAVMGLYSVFLGLGQLIGSGGGGVFVKAIGQGFNGLILAVFLLGLVALLTVIWLRRSHGV